MGLGKRTSEQSWRRRDTSSGFFCHLPFEHVEGVLRTVLSSGTLKASMTLVPFTCASNILSFFIAGMYSNEKFLRQMSYSDKNEILSQRTQEFCPFLYTGNVPFGLLMPFLSQ